MTPEEAAQNNIEKPSLKRDVKVLSVPESKVGSFTVDGLLFPTNASEQTAIIQKAIHDTQQNTQVVDKIDPKQISHRPDQLVIQLNKGEFIGTTQTGVQMTDQDTLGNDISIQIERLTVGPPIGWEINHVVMDQNEVVLVLDEENQQSISGRITLLPETGAGYTITPDLKQLDELNSKLGGDPELQKMHKQFYTELAATNDPDVQSEIILKHLQLLGNWVDEQKFYKIIDQGGLVWTADNPNAGFSCIGGSQLTHDFLRSAGVDAELNHSEKEYLRGDYFWWQWMHSNNIIHLPNGRMVLVDNVPLVKEGLTPQDDLDILKLDEPDYFDLHQEEANKLAAELGITLDTAWQAFLAGKLIENNNKPQVKDSEELAKKFISENGRKLKDNEVIEVTAVATKLLKLVNTSEPAPEIFKLLEGVCKTNSDLVVSWANADDKSFDAIVANSPAEAFDTYANAVGSRENTYFSSQLNEAVRNRNGQMVRAREDEVAVSKVDVPEEFENARQLAQCVFEADIDRMANQIRENNNKKHRKADNRQSMNLIRKELERLYKSFDTSWPQENKAMVYALYQLFS